MKVWIIALFWLGKLQLQRTNADDNTNTYAYFNESMLCLYFGIAVNPKVFHGI